MSNTLQPGASLNAGGELISNNSAYKAILQSDGNFVVLEVPGLTPIWSTGTSGHLMGHAHMQNDGNFVIYDSGNAAIWATNTASNSGSTLQLGDDGILKVLNNGIVLWASPTAMPIYNVRTYGAIGNGTTNDTIAIQRAIDAAFTAKGGTVFFPPGKYLIGSKIVLKGAVHLLGSGWSTDNADSGSFIYYTSSFSGDAVEVTGRNSLIEQLGFACEQPPSSSPWEPNSFGGGAAIHIHVDDVTVRNVLLYNVTRGIDCSNETGAIGRITLDRIYGQPLTQGIKIDNAMDVIKVNNVHFWPFWTSSPSSTPVAEIRKYVQDHGVGIESFRNDNPFFSDIFCFGYCRGMKFSTSANPGGTGVDPVIWGKTSLFQIVNAGMDSCKYGLFIDGNNTTGQISNFYSQGPDFDHGMGYEGISVPANGVQVQASNVHIAFYNSNGIRVAGSDTKLMLSNLWIRDWNQSQQSFPAVENIDASSKVYVGIGWEFVGGYNAPDFGGAAGTIVKAVETPAF